MLHTNSEDRRTHYVFNFLTCIKCTRLPICGGTTPICSRDTPFLAGYTPCFARNTHLCREQTHPRKKHTHLRRVYAHPCRVRTHPHTELPFSVLTWSEFRKMHMPLHMVVSGIAQDTRLSPSFPFQPQCRDHTVVIRTCIFLPGALQPAYRSTCRHPY